MLLAIEHYNRPWDRGRPETVLIQLDRSFEMLLKAAIVHKGGRIREPRAGNTIGFDKCVRKCVSEAQVKCVSEEQALTLQMINSLRDAAQHYLLDIPEEELYLHTQAGVTLFSDLMSSVFGRNLAHDLPERVLPVSTRPPSDLHVLMREQVEVVRTLLTPGSRKRVEAKARLRSLAIMEKAVTGETAQPTERELNGLMRKIVTGNSWSKIFPGVARLRLDTEGSGLSFNIRFSKKEGTPIRLVKEGEPTAAVVAVRRVNELDYYNMGLKGLAVKAGLSMPRTLAVIQELGLQNDDDYFKEIKIGSQRYKRYSRKSLEKIKGSLGGMDLEDVWRRHKPTGRRRRT